MTKSKPSVPGGQSGGTPEAGDSDSIYDAGSEVIAAALRAAIIHGELSGEPQPFDFDAFIARKHAERDSR